MAKHKRSDTEKRDVVINQLFGSLEEDTDIEQDITELGAEEPAEEEAPAREQKKGHGFFFGFAIFVIIMAIVGCVTTVRLAAGFISSLADSTSLKNEMAQLVLPVVANDIAPFSGPADIPNSARVTCAVWNILINHDTEPYMSEGVMLTIPEYDVTASFKEMFGSSATLEHQTVGTAELQFTYDEENHVYTASKNIRYLNYAPRIVEMTESGGNYTLTVAYIPPTIGAVAGISGMEASPEKYMTYIINRWDNTNTIISLDFSDYSERVGT